MSGLPTDLFRPLVNLLYKSLGAMSEAIERARGPLYRINCELRRGVMSHNVSHGEAGYDQEPGQPSDVI